MKVEMPPGEVLDRLAILFVKRLFLVASKDSDENIRFYKNFKKDVLDGFLELGQVKPKLIFKTYLKFIRLHKKSWGVRDQMEAAAEAENADSYFKFCREAHIYNLERRNLKNFLNEQVGVDFKEASNFKK